MELLCPAGNLPALKTAIDCGADAVYIGFKDDTNARHFAGLNFNGKKLEKAVQYVHDRNKKIHVALNTFAHPNGFERWTNAVDNAAALGVDALIVADIAVLEYAARKYPDLELHLSVQASATNVAAIDFYKQNFNVKRVVLPRVLSIHQVKQLSRNITSDVFGSLCIMSEGRCYLSSYMTGESPNTVGACSPAKYVRWQETENGLESRLNDILIDRYSTGENAGYPTLCKGRFEAEIEGEKKRYHALEEPTSLNTLSMLPELFAANVASVKIEGRQRSPAYVEQVTRTWRAAIDRYQANPEAYQVEAAWDAALANVSEGTQTTLGAYHRKWQ
ncbi:ubiquinone anaerobic biosynthesis protein UbiU [Vibrio alginolyticus]|uniref:ubiquinone anaerobic biosynthesis protein UbiU n=1 Tax=Vibrio alginolyticus TaxID=663 RepID=UPI001BD273EA|nr:peptidase U32 family protein [Vibrio alginolyticus]MBS9893196.1 U32 family peptidase [Vibrio alginolyticus]